jgi:hypothetical protein
MYLCGGSPDFFHIWTTEVLPYNALNSEFANPETPPPQRYIGLKVLFELRFDKYRLKSSVFIVIYGVDDCGK